MTPSPRSCSLAGGPIPPWKRRRADTAVETQSALRASGGALTGSIPQLRRGMRSVAGNERLGRGVGDDSHDSAAGLEPAAAPRRPAPRGVCCRRPRQRNSSLQNNAGGGAGGASDCRRSASPHSYTTTTRPALSGERAGGRCRALGRLGPGIGNEPRRAGPGPDSWPVRRRRGALVRPPPPSPSRSRAAPPARGAGGPLHTHTRVRVCGST